MTHPNPPNHTASFLSAVERGDLDRVRNFLHSGTPVDAADENGVTGLILAASLGHLRIVDEFLDAGADIDRGDRHGYTALIEASRHGHPDVVRRLLHAGAALTIDVNRNENNAVLFALDAGHEGIADLLHKAAPPRSIPMLRGVESFDLDARWVAVRGGVDHVGAAFAHRRNLARRRDVYGAAVQLSSACYLAMQFRAHEWTLITELHVDAPVQHLGPKDAEALAHVLAQKALFFETSDLAGRFRYKCFHAGQWTEDFDSAREEMLISRQRRVSEAELVNPEAFVSRFIALQGVFIPAVAVGFGKAGDEGPMRIPGYLKTDFERVDFLG